MKKYKYVRLDYIEEYNGWEIIKIIPAVSEDMYDMAVLSFEDTPKEDKKIEMLDTLVLSEYFTNNELAAYIFETQVKINEIIKRLNGKDNDR